MQAPSDIHELIPFMNTLQAEQSLQTRVPAFSADVRARYAHREAMTIRVKHTLEALLEENADGRDS